VLNRSVDHVQTVITATESIEDFFARYTGYLTGGDIDGLAATHNYPSLAVTAMGCLAITEPQQSRASSLKASSSIAAAASKAYALATS
jgi:hypothetical protein